MGVTLFPYYNLGGGGLWKISNENYIEHGGGATILQELKDDLLDDTEWPVVMQWFNEDHISVL